MCVCNISDNIFFISLYTRYIVYINIYNICIVLKIFHFMYIPSILTYFYNCLKIPLVQHPVFFFTTFIVFPPKKTFKVQMLVMTGVASLNPSCCQFCSRRQQEAKRDCLTVVRERDYILKKPETEGRCSFKSAAVRQAGESRTRWH